MIFQRNTKPRKAWFKRLRFNWRKTSDEKEALDCPLDRIKKLVERNNEMELRCQEFIEENERHQALLGLLDEIDEIL